MAYVVPRLSGKAGNFLVRFEMVTAISTGITIKCSGSVVPNLFQAVATCRFQQNDMAQHHTAIEKSSITQQ